MMNRKQAGARNLSRFGFLFVIAFVGILIALFIPWNAWAFASHPQPVQNYEEAAQRIEALRANRQSEMNRDCLLQFLTHGQKVQHVVILVHGYTNCPAQFAQLGQQLYDLGYNVLIAPLPHHGLANRMNNEQGRLTARELTAYADEMVDLAHGLGEQVDIMGISAGGVTAAWVAQNRSDVETAVMISPAFGYQQIPTLLTAPMMNASLALPDTFTWWDETLKEDIAPLHAYPRYSRHSLAEFLRLGFAVQLKSWRTAPAAQRVIVVTNANDTAVNNKLTMEVVRRWQRNGDNVMTYEFPSNLGLSHDLIDPEQPDQQVDVTYPQLIGLLTMEH